MACRTSSAVLAIHAAWPLLIGCTFADPLDNLVSGPGTEFRAEHLIYEGAFKVDETDLPLSNFSYSEAIIAYNPDGDAGNGSLLLSSHVYQWLFAEIGIPKIEIRDEVDDLEVAPVLQPFFDPSGGLRDTFYSAEFGGIALHEGRLFWTIRVNDSGNPPSHGMTELDLTALGGAMTVSGLWPLDYPNARTAGYVAPVPPAWRNALGFPLLSGAACPEHCIGGSNGPAAVGFEPTPDGTAPPAGATLPALELLSFPSIDADKRELASYTLDGVAHTWKGANQLGGAVFAESPDGDRTALIFFVKVGLHPDDYRGPVEDFTGTACEGGPGYHAGPYRVMAWLYHPADLASVARDELDPWEVAPYEMLDLTEHWFSGPDCPSVGSATLDSRNGRIFVSEASAYPGAHGPRPVIHVFRIR